MSEPGTLQYRVELSWDPETQSVVAEVPALSLADSGADVREALANIKAMATFHLECLQEEGGAIPASQEGEEGFFVHVKLPVHAASSAPGA